MLAKPIIDLPEEYRPSIDDLPGDLRWIASVIEEALPGMGVRITLILAQRFNGPVYFRQVTKFINAWWHDKIRAEYNSGDITRKELVVKTGLSLTQINRILDSPSMQDGQKAKQMYLF